MNPAVIAVLIALGAAAVIAVITGVVLAVRRRAAERRAGFETVAQQRGWSFAADPVQPETLGLGPFPLLALGRAQRASNVIRLSGEHTIAVFDYQYTVGAGQHQSTVVQTVAHVRSPRLALPPFTLSPENIFHKIGGAFGYHDIDFDTGPEFSRTYLLRSKEAEGRVRELFTPALRAFFEQRTPVSVEGHADELLVYKSGRRVEPADLPAFAEDAQTIARQLEM
jgi:hypothetical protein